MGLITTVVEFGCFVQLLACGVDGLLPWRHCATMTIRWHATAASGIGTAQRAGGLAPGTRLRVVVAAVNPVEGLIDLELATD